MFAPSLARLAASSPIAVGFLVLANTIPLLGVLLLGWDLMTIIRLYWLENGIVGFYAVLRILTAEGTGAGTAGRIRAPTLIAPAGVLGRVILVPFFVFHYGMFWLVHGVFVWAAFPLLFAPGSEPVVDPTLPPELLAGPALGAIAFAAFALFVSHGVSYVVNWLGRGEYRTATSSEEMGAPYGRVVVLHLTIIFGAFAVAALGAPVWALVVMVVLKTGLDLGAHVRDRERAARRAETLEAAPPA